MIIIPNGVDPRRFRFENNSAEIHKLKLQYGLPTMGPILASINILSPRKNILKLLAVAMLLKKHFSALIFIIVFPRPRTNEEQEVLHQLLIKTKAQLWIHLMENPANIENIYKISTIVVSLTRQDHFPLILLESLASKVLFMGTPMGEISTILNQIDSRLTIKSHTVGATVEQILSVLSLSQRRLNIIRKKGHQLATSYSWSNIATQITDALATSNSR